MNRRSFMLAALIAGAAIGALGNLPLFNLINCFLCIWVWVGGFLAVYLYRRFEHGVSVLSPGQGAGVGALAGLIGAFVGIVVYSLTSFISAPLFGAVERALQIEGDVPFQSGVAGVPEIIGSALVFLLLDVVLYPLFGAISGLIAASMGTKPAPA
ncbi:MAG: hypothetical protein U0768_13120 [Anaerolineae bacterium]